MGKFQDLTGRTFGRWTVKRREKNDVNGKSVFLCACECGTEKNVSASSLLSGKSKSCGCLASDKSQMHKFVDVSGKRFGRLVAMFPVDTSVTGETYDTRTWRCKCDCGNICDVKYCSLYTGNTASCGCKKRDSISDRCISDISGKKFGSLLVLNRTKSHKNRAMWECLCDCGNMCVVCGKYLRSGKTTSCGCVKSSAERNLKIVLNTSGILFNQQKVFCGCEYKGQLFFDVYIPEMNLCIELDGIQHFEPIEFFGGVDAFIETQIRDQIKNTYCAEHNINLLRIPYTQFHRLEEICKENNIIKGELNART